MNANIKVRAMTTTDMNEVIAIHAKGFPASRSTKLGKPFLRKMYEWFILFQPDLSFVALQGDKVIGFVTGTKGWGGGHRRFKYTFWYIIWGFLRQPHFFFSVEMYKASRNYLRVLLRNMTRKKAKNKENTQLNLSAPKLMKFTLDSIAVHPDARGMKIGQMLNSAFEESAKKNGAAYLALGVEYDNNTARRFYEYCGWDLVHDDIEQNSANYIKKNK